MASLFGEILSSISKAGKLERNKVANGLAKQHGAVGFNVTNSNVLINHPEIAPELKQIKGGNILDSNYIGLPNKAGGYDIVPSDAIKGGYESTRHDYGGGRYFFDSDFKPGHGAYNPDQMRNIVPASVNADGSIVKKGSFTLSGKGNKMAEDVAPFVPKSAHEPATNTLVYNPANTPNTPKGGFAFKESQVKRIPTDFSAAPEPSAPRASAYNPNNTPSTPAGGFKLPNKHLNDFRPTSAPKKSVQDIFKKAYDNQKRQEALESRKRIAGYMRDNEAAAAAAENNKGVKGVINSVKSSVANMKAKYNQATEALYEIAGKNHTPTEFQQQTTAMVGKFSGGKWTGGVNTEKMNWLEANAHENLYSSVGRDYDNLIAKMQGAKTQEEFSKLMEDHHIKYSDGMSGAELNKNVNAHFNERIDGGPGVGNYIVGNRVASAAMLGVAGASVLALSDSRGSRSNSQLYSSQI